MGPPAIPRWRSSAGPALAWRSWGAERVVYDARSGDIHLLDEVAASIVTALAEAPADAATAARGVAESLGLPSEPALEGQVRVLLARLEELGLIERSTE